MKKPTPKFRNNKKYIAMATVLQLAIFCGPPKPDYLPTEKETPVPTVEEVQVRLRSTDEVERGMAAAEVLRYSYRELTGDLMKILQSDPSDNARTAAAIALGALGEQKAGPLIVTLIKDKRGQTDLLIEALGDLKNPAWGAAAVPLLGHEDTMTRLKAAEALGKMKASAQGANILSQAQKQKAPDIIEAHIVALGNIGYRPAEVFIIARANENPQSTIAAAGLLALGKLRSRQAIPLLLKAVAGKDAKLQENAAAALRQLPEPASATGLFDIFKSDLGDAGLMAIDILADYPANLTRSQARSILQGEKKHLYAGAAFILGKLKDSESRERIETILRDSQTHNREMTARALGYLNARESIAVLREVAREKDGSARYGALWSLGIMEAREALPEIRSAVASPDRQFAAYGLEALAAMPSEEDLQLLESRLNKDDGTQLLAASAIARIPGDKAREVLEQAASSKKLTIRSAGFEGLALRSDRAALPFLIKQLETGDAEVRKMAMSVLRNTTKEQFDSPAKWLNWYKTSEGK